MLCESSVRGKRASYETRVDTHRSHPGWFSKGQATTDNRFSSCRRDEYFIVERGLALAGNASLFQGLEKVSGSDDLAILGTRD
jgi:hypothetical protein